MDMIHVVKDAAIIIGVPVVRSVVGWAENALSDNNISEFEIKQLVQTILRVGTMGLFGYLGFEAIGVEQSAVIAAVTSFFGDKLLLMWKKR